MRTIPASLVVLAIASFLGGCAAVPATPTKIVSAPPVPQTAPPAATALVAAAITPEPRCIGTAASPREVLDWEMINPVIRDMLSTDLGVQAALAKRTEACHGPSATRCALARRKLEAAVKKAAKATL